MNVERFKEEFRELRRRFAATETDDNVRTIGSPLTNNEILDAVHEVLNLKHDVTLVDSMRDDIRTPASGIVMTTPNAPDMPKLNVEHNGGMTGRFRSLDTLRAESLRDSSIVDLIVPEPGPLTAKTNGDVDVFTIDVPDARNDEKKQMSRSSPAVSTLVRSDTFVREDELENVNNGDVEKVENNKIEPEVIVNDFGNEHQMTEGNLTDIIKKLMALKDSLIDITNNIDDIQKAVPEKSCPIRRLSAMGCFPGLNRTATASKTTQRSKMTRRSFAAFPDTPTSSRLSPGTEAKNDAMRRKSTSSLSLMNVGAAKLSIAPANRSVSSGALVLPKKLSTRSTSQTGGSQFSGIKAPKATTTVKSPALSLLNVANKSPAYRQTKNSKYAHVQSTIPKSALTLGKRQSSENLKQ